MSDSPSLQTFAAAFQKQTSVAGCGKGLYGRVLRGTKPEHFTSLTHEPDRLIILLLGQDGLENLIGLSGRQILATIIKYTDRHIQELIAEGHEFKLVVFPKTDSDVHQATWQNTVDVTARVYPEVKDKLFGQLTGLQTTRFEDIEKAAGYCFYDAYKAGDKHSGYMNYDRLRASEGTLAQVRAFLFHTLHLREPFEGTGYTGKQREYFMLNIRLQDLDNHCLLPLNVI